MISCKKCGSTTHVKAGFIKGEQRYLCKDCGCKFVPTRRRGASQKQKLTAVWLYSHGLSFRAIAKFFGVNVRTAYIWVKSFAEENYIKPEPGGEAVVIELDEMRHYLQSKKTNFGSGRLIAAIPISSSTGNAEDETMIHLQSFTND